MAKEVYGSRINQGRRINLVDDLGKARPTTLLQPTGVENGSYTFTNDASKGKYQVIVGTSPDYQSENEETFEALKDLYTATQPDDPMRGVLLRHLIMLKEAPNLNDLQEYLRNEMLIAGYIKPETEEDVALLQQVQQAQANQPNDAQTQFILSEAKRAESEAAENLADIEAKRAKAMRDIAEAEQTQVETRLMFQQ
jgi:hypothetical protein